MAFADHFSTIAARYATYRPRYPDAVVDTLVKLAPARALAWDAGCGTGQLSVPLASRFERVVATDPSRQQIAHAEAAPNVEYRVEPAEHSTLADGSADLIVAAQAAHWFDWPRFVAEAGRVAKPGALLALVSYGVPEVPELAAYRAAIAPYWPRGREHVENGYRDLVWPWPAVDAPSMELVEQWTGEELLGYVTTWSATVKMTAATGTGALEALALPPERRAIRWPLTVKLARHP
jgi:SAM-dependent methyltransferase